MLDVGGCFGENAILSIRAVRKATCVSTAPAIPDGTEEVVEEASNRAPFVETDDKEAGQMHSEALLDDIYLGHKDNSGAFVVEKKKNAARKGSLVIDEEEEDDYYGDGGGARVSKLKVPCSSSLDRACPSGCLAPSPDWGRARPPAPSPPLPALW
jgi:hypothetical protein